MLQHTSRSAATGSRQCRASSRPVPFNAAAIRAIRTQASPQASDASCSGAAVTRRDLLLGATLSASALQLPGSPALADATYTEFFGYATPPTSYGGYGGNAKEAPRYTFEYPSSWKEEQPSKVEKGTQGVDGRVVNPRVKGQRAFVITLGRAGEDNKAFRLNDVDSTFQGFAGADYDLQDALSAAAEIKKDQKEVDGNAFYLYDIDSPENRYLACITVSSGKVFALFVKSPSKSFDKGEAQLRHIIETFKLL